MTNSEFDNEFDVLYNSITSNQAPGLDTYEKSVFLTKAQDDIIKAYFDPRLNKVQEGFDDSERRQIDFSRITVTLTYDHPSKFSPAIFVPQDNSKSIIGATDALMILNERLKVNREGKTVLLTVVPINFKDFDRVMSKPFKRPIKYQAWRVFNYSSAILKSDLVVGPGDEITEYSVRYVKRPKPIILGDLDGLTINGLTYNDVKGKDACELDPILHKEVLQRAVELAKAAYAGDLTSQVALGQSSQTELGIVTSGKQ